MESWRQELYDSLSHSVEGSSWKNHKYIAIENGRYIYPEDLSNGKKSSSNAEDTSTSGGSSSGSSGKKSDDNRKKDYDAKSKVKNKGSVKSYEYLPDDPEIGDMYLLEDTKVKVYWDGEIWTPYNEDPVQTGGGYRGSRDSGEGPIGNYRLRPETVDRIRNILSGSSIRSNVRGFGGGR